MHQQKIIGVFLRCKIKLWNSWIFSDQTFLGLGLVKLFPDSESLLSDIPAGDGNLLNLFLQCMLFKNITHTMRIYIQIYFLHERAKMYIILSCPHFVHGFWINLKNVLFHWANKCPFTMCWETPCFVHECTCKNLKNLKNLQILVVSAHLH